MRAPLHFAFAAIAFSSRIACTQDQPDRAAREVAIVAFNQAMNDDKLLGSGGAVELLEKMKPLLPEDEWNNYRDSLVLEKLITQADPIVARYTTGDEVPQLKQDYDRCADLYEAANRLSPDKGTEARMWFCKGRAEYIGKNVQLAVEDFAKSIQVAPERFGGFHFNALGAAYLAQGDLVKAKSQFEAAENGDTSGWTYPLHNKAVASIDNGDYEDAGRKYCSAIEKAVRGQLTGYLHYNLGIIYYELKRKSEAQCELEVSLKLFRERNEENNEAEAYNALGALWKSQGKKKEAEEAYRRSLDLNPHLTAADTNLKLLLGSRKRSAAARMDLNLSSGEVCKCEAAK